MVRILSSPSMRLFSLVVSWVVVKIPYSDMLAVVMYAEKSPAVSSSSNTESSFILIERPMPRPSLSASVVALSMPFRMFWI